MDGLTVSRFSGHVPTWRYDQAPEGLVCWLVIEASHLGTQPCGGLSAVAR